MGRVASAIVWALVLAALGAGGMFGAIMLSGPKGDPSVYGTALLASVGAAIVGALAGAIYGALKRQ